MKLVIDHLDGALPSGAEAPLAVEIVRRLGAPDGAPWWLGRMAAAEADGRPGHAGHVVVAGSLHDGAPVRLGWLTDPRQIEATAVDLATVRLVATGTGRIEDGDDDGGMEAYA